MKNRKTMMVRIDLLDLDRELRSRTPETAIKWLMQVVTDIISLNTHANARIARESIRAFLKVSRANTANALARHRRNPRAKGSTPGHEDPEVMTGNETYVTGSFKNVRLTAGDEIKLRKALGDGYGRAVEYLSCWKVNHARQARKIRSDYAAIVQWVAARISEERRKEPRKSFRRQDEEIREQRLREALPDVFAKYGL